LKGSQKEKTNKQRTQKKQTNKERKQRIEAEHPSGHPSQKRAGVVKVQRTVVK